MRNPLLDPQPGDQIVRNNGNCVLARTVTKRQGGEVFYRDRRGRDRQCWIGTWMEWAAKAEVVVVA